MSTPPSTSHPDPAPDDPGSESAMPAPPTVRERLLGAGISPQRVDWWLASGGVRVDGEHISDPAFPAPPPARVVLQPL